MLAAWNRGCRHEWQQYMTPDASEFTAALLPSLPCHVTGKM
jgi:hypothetical protein